jgi:prefoldin alpha subunit
MSDAAPSKDAINLFALSLEQLNQLKQSIEEELQGLNGAILQLQVSRNKLTTSKEALKRLADTPEGTSMLVPITSSLYVPGETTALDSILVDVGTGAHVLRWCSASFFSQPSRWAPPHVGCPPPPSCPSSCPPRRRPCPRLSGYFIEKSTDEAQAFLSRKMALIESQAQNVQSAAQFKQQNLSNTVDVMNRKIMEMRAGAGSSSEGGS